MYSMCNCQFVEEMIWPSNDIDLIICPWDFSVAQYELVNLMDMMTKNVSSLTLQHYVLIKNRYNHHFFHRDFDVIENKLIFCNGGINILYCTLIKPVLKYDPYHVDRFEKCWC